jgi:hypothetical protein
MLAKTTPENRKTTKIKASASIFSLRRSSFLLDFSIRFYRYYCYGKHPFNYNWAVFAAINGSEDRRLSGGKKNRRLTGSAIKLTLSRFDRHNGWFMRQIGDRIFIGAKYS